MLAGQNCKGDFRAETFSIDLCRKVDLMGFAELTVFAFDQRTGGESTQSFRNVFDVPKAGREKLHGSPTFLSGDIRRFQGAGEIMLHEVDETELPHTKFT